MSDPKPPPADPEAPVSDTFCIHLWNHFRVEGSGEAAVCCAYEGGHVAEDGRPMSLERHSLEQIWNSATMRELRRDMVAGRRIPGCRQCYADEERGGLSQRLRDNAAWEAGWLNPGVVPIRELMARAADSDFRVERLPGMIEVETGNLCNLKCRMCNAATSSLIGKDPVHRVWSDGRRTADDTYDPYKLRPPVSVERLADELAKDTAGQVKRLYFIGGEPLQVREVRGLLESLIATGHAHEIDLQFVTNCTVLPRWLSLTTQFRHVDFVVSIDGYGETFEYIRYPAVWPTLLQRLQTLRELPNSSICVNSTIQIYNALTITRLFRHLDTLDIQFFGYLMHWPRRLAAAALPPPVRQLAATRLRDYAESDCLPRSRELVLAFANQFEAGGGEADPELMRDLMLFTNDLDATRGQSIHQADPELVAALAGAGFPWIDERRLAGGDGG